MFEQDHDYIPIGTMCQVCDHDERCHPTTVSNCVCDSLPCKVCGAAPGALHGIIEYVSDKPLSPRKPLDYNSEGAYN